MTSSANEVAEALVRHPGIVAVAIGDLEVVDEEAARMGRKLLDASQAALSHWESCSPIPWSAGDLEIRFGGYRSIMHPLPDRTVMVLVVVGGAPVTKSLQRMIRQAEHRLFPGGQV